MGTPMSQCIVFGAAPQENWEFLSGYLKENPYIVCADGGQLHAKALGLTPHCVLGDWDSGGKPLEGTHHYTLPCEKDVTDLQGALEVALKEGYKEFILCGCLGGRLDHTAFNFYLLEWLHQQGSHGILLDNHHEIHYLANGTLILPPDPRFTYLSILPVDAVVEGVTIKGAKYPLAHETLYRGQTRSVSNEILDCPCTISVEQGGLLIFRTTSF